MYRTPLNRENVVRLPLAASTFSRIVESASGTSSSSGIVGVGVVGSMIVGLTVSSLKDQRLVNCFIEKVSNQFSGEEKYYITKRPGFASNTTPAAGEGGSAIRVWAGSGGGTSLISAFGLTNSTIYEDEVSLGSVTGVVYDIEETLIGTTPNLLFTTASNKGYFYPDGGALTEITDVDFPANASQTITGGFVPLNGYCFVMTTSGRIYNSDLNSIANWSATSFLSSNIKPDQGVGLARYKHYIVAFGKESMEFYKDKGNATGSPLERVEDASINIGVVSSHAFKSIADTLAWIGTTAESGIGVYILDGLQPKKISTAPLDSILASTSTTGMYLNVVNIAGQTFIVLVSQSDSRTYAYSIEFNLWHEWTSTTVLWTHMCGIGAGTRNVYAVSQGSTTGKTFVINPTSYVFQDNGVNYTVTIQTTKFDGDTLHRKFMSKMWVVGDNYASTNNVTISWSDDDYQTFTSGRTVNLGSAFRYINGCGSFRRRAFKITQDNSMPLRLEALEFMVKQGIH